jgi:putative flippase GtrA
MSRFARYAAVGVLATAAHYLVLIAGVELVQLPAVAAATLGAMVGALVSYACNRAFTFPDDALRRLSFIRFGAVAAVGVALTAAIVFVGVDVLRFGYLPSQVAATLVVLVTGFALNRWWSFR